MEAHILSVDRDLCSLDHLQGAMVHRHFNILAWLASSNSQVLNFFPPSSFPIFPIFPTLLVERHLCRQLEEFCLQSCFCFMSAVWGFVARFQWGFWQGFWTESSSSIESLEWYQTLSKICCFCWFNDERDLLFVVRCCQTIMTTNSRSGTSSKKSLISLGQEKRGDFNFFMLNLSAGEMMGVVVGQISIEVILHISVRLLHL